MTILISICLFLLISYSILYLFITLYFSCFDIFLLDHFFQQSTRPVFKWIKQNLKIKTFLGTSKNAVLSQIWVAMIYTLLLAYIKFQTKSSFSILKLSRIFSESLFFRRHLIDLLGLSPPNSPKIHTFSQLKLC